MSPTTRPLNARRAAAVVLVTLSLTGVGACAVSIGGGSSDQETAAAAGQESSAPEHGTEVPRNPRPGPGAVDGGFPGYDGDERLPGAPIGDHCAECPGTGLACCQRFQRPRGQRPARKR